MTLYLLTLALAITQILDAYTTRVILKNGGHEVNPIARKLMDWLTVDGFLVVKGIAVTAAGYWAGTQVIEVLVGFVVLYTGVVSFNWRSMPK